MCSQFSPGLPGLPQYLESVGVNIGMVLRADGGWSVYGHVITKFSGMDRFTYPCGAARVLRNDGAVQCSPQ